MLASCASISDPEKNSRRLAEAMTVLGSSDSSPAQITRARESYRRSLESSVAGLDEDQLPTGFKLAEAKPPKTVNPTAFKSFRRAPQNKTSLPGLHRDGLGLPLVGTLERDSLNAPTFGYRMPFTLLATDQEILDGKTEISLAVADPDRFREIQLGTQKYPVAMNWEAAALDFISEGPGGLTGLINLIRVDLFGDSRLVALQPYKPEKIPIVMVHGLLSTPVIWADLVMSLLEDETIRERYQFWFFYYPSGQPVPLSAMQLRESLDQARTTYNMSQPFVLVGHSMGGLLSRAQITGMSLNQVSQILPTVTELPIDNIVRRSLVFNPRNDVSRAIFISVPHRGSRMADQGIAGFAARLVRFPRAVQAELGSVVESLASFGGVSGRLPTSIQGLSPKSRFLQLLDEAPTAVPMHSIIGDRGRRGELADSSDGVVPYSSSHRADAQSEVIFAGGHSGFVQPNVIEELKRILALE